MTGVFQNFRKICLKFYHLDPVTFYHLKLELLADIDMLLMVEKGITGGTCHAIRQSAKANNKYMKNYDKNKESSYLK